LVKIAETSHHYIDPWTWTKKRGNDYVFLFNVNSLSQARSGSLLFAQMGFFPANLPSTQNCTYHRNPRARDGTYVLHWGQFF
jgi:hypothetical protein